MLGCHQAGLDKGFLRGSNFRDQRDLLAVEGRFVLVALAVMRREKIGGDLFGEIDGGIEGFARMLGEPGT